MDFYIYYCKSQSYGITVSYNSVILNLIIRELLQVRAIIAVMMSAAYLAVLRMSLTNGPVSCECVVQFPLNPNVKVDIVAIVGA